MSSDEVNQDEGFSMHGVYQKVIPTVGIFNLGVEEGEKMWNQRATNDLDMSKPLIPVHNARFRSYSQMFTYYQPVLGDLWHLFCPGLKPPIELLEFALILILLYSPGNQNIRVLI